ncbi:MAG: cofactor-independent phosphoglycerate mutase [Epulopiscium sp.]|nr:cofactor-independent phosphoglycerate mutase [Candidatus Epulonipiscium sp.]
MKHIVVLGDGMADKPLDALGGQTPLQKAHKPMMDWLAKHGEVGLLQTIPKGLEPGSDTANLSVLGYDPRLYYTGRSPLEAVSMGVSLEEEDITFRCNLVTLSEEEPYEQKRILDHSADEISTAEAEQLIKAIQQQFQTEFMKFYSGISYRHLLVWKGGPLDLQLTPPHDILEKRIQNYLPQGENAQILFEMMKKSYAILHHHPVNQRRIKQGLRPANSLWFWGEGKKPNLPSFEQKYHCKGSVISAVDLIKGIAISSGLHSVQVQGATGNIDTNYEGKAQAALQELKRGQDFVYIHIEAPDECGHRQEIDNKVKAIEYIDAQIVTPIKETLDKEGQPYRILILPDHPTPLSLRTHTDDPVPYVLYDSTLHQYDETLQYDEHTAKKTGIFHHQGHLFMNTFISQHCCKEGYLC